MLTTTLLAVLGLLLAFVIWQMMRSSGGQNRQVTGAGAAPATLPTSVASSVELSSAKPGDVLSIAGAAEDFSDLDFTVDRRSAYQSGNRRWIDLSGEFRNRRVYLEVQPGPDPDILGLLDERRLTLNDLGVSEEQLAAMDARQDTSGSLQFEGRTWQYLSSRELGYFENESGAGEGLYRWIFRDPGSSQLVCVEKWEGEPFEARIGQRLKLHDITVFRAA